MTRSFRFPRLTLFGSLCLGLVLAVLVSGPAGAASSEEARLFNLASHDKDHGAVQQLLAKGVSPNVPVNFGKTAVHEAAEGGAVQNLSALLQAGGDLHARDRDGNTPLHLASRGSFSGHADAVRVLLQRGADLHRPNARGETPLHVAVYGDVGAAHADVIKTLLDAGARPETVDGNGLTALQRFVRHSGDKGRIVTLLIRAGADPDQKDPRGDVPLHAAIKEGGSNGKAAIVEALLAGGANPCVQDDRGYTPYQISSRMQRIHRALSRAEGDDLTCDKSNIVYDEGAWSEDEAKMAYEGNDKSDDSSKMAYEEGDESDDTSGMSYGAELRALGRKGGRGPESGRGANRGSPTARGRAQGGGRSRAKGRSKTKGRSCGIACSGRKNRSGAESGSSPA